MKQINLMPGIEVSAAIVHEVQGALFDEAVMEQVTQRISLDREKKRGRKKQKQQAVAGKNFILDTNVLLHDPHSVMRFEENHVWIPVDVLGELDRFKNEQSDRGASARAVHRMLSKAFEQSNASVVEGVQTDGGGSLRLAVEDVEGRDAVMTKFRRIFPDMNRVDHRIIATALLLRERTGQSTILVTKDLNMALKARAVGLVCEDYLNDKVEARDVERYETRRVEVSPTEMQRFASSGELALSEAKVAALVINEYVLLESSNRKTMPARFSAEGIFKKLRIPDHLHIPKGIELRPMNLGQQCFLDALLDPEIELVTCYGQAGTGKTLMAVAAGLHEVFNHVYGGVTVSRPVVAMGDTLGFLPGTLDEKMKPWLQPIYDALEVLMPHPGVLAHESHSRKNTRRANKKNREAPPACNMSGPGKKPYETLIEQGLVEIEALCYIRGRSIPRRFFILDEAQQLTPLEAKTLVTRMSKGSKLVLVGDPAQIDNPYVDSRSNGLVYTRNRLKGQSIAAHVSLSKGERSPLAELGAKWM